MNIYSIQNLLKYATTSWTSLITLRAYPVLHEKLHGN